MAQSRNVYALPPGVVTMTRGIGFDAIVAAGAACSFLSARRVVRRTGAASQDHGATQVGGGGAWQLRLRGGMCSLGRGFGCGVWVVSLFG